MQWLHETRAAWMELFPCQRAAQKAGLLALQLPPVEQPDDPDRAETSPAARSAS